MSEDVEQPKDAQDTPAEAATAEPHAAGGEGEPGVGGAAAPPEKLLRAQELTTALLGHLGIAAEVEVRDSAEAIGVRLEVKQGAELLQVGPRGQVLEAIQYLVNKMVNRELEGRKWVAVEVGSFPETPAEVEDPAMDEMARRLGEAAKRLGKTLTVVPMQARDRKRVHLALASVAGVKTRSDGEGLFRRLLVEPEG